VQGRITDGQGHPLAGVVVSAVQVHGSDPSQQYTSVMAKGTTGPDGAFDFPVYLGSYRLLVRAQVGATVFLPRLGPAFELKSANTAVAGLDLALTATVPASLSLTISPVHGAQQEDNLMLEQILLQDGVSYYLAVVNLKPAVVAGQEVVPILNQPPGTYTLSLVRSETTGTHAISGSAQAGFTLVEGGMTELTLTVP
jgi:hypothetical protein